MPPVMPYARLDDIRKEIEKEWGKQPPIWVTDLYTAVERCTCGAPDLSELAASLGYGQGSRC